MNPSFNLEGKTILVTGGTRGVGRAISLAFASAGARVLANYVRNQSAADTLVAEAAAKTLDIRTIRADISSEAGARQLLDIVDSQELRLDGFIHCAATGVHKPVEQLTLRHFDWTFALNIRAFFNLTTQLLPRFAPGASIVALSSAGAQRAIEQYTLVGASKGALESMVRHLAVELAPKGIRVNAVSPGTLHTDAWQAMPNAAERLERAARDTPLQRLVTLDEVAQTVLFLTSAAASGIVGQTLVVDGGSRLRAS